MHRSYAMLLAGLLMFTFMGCGSAEPSIKAGDPSTKNNVDAPDTTKFVVQTHKGQSTTDKR
jgi:hypothetical protein